ncbi:MAG: hypothetical protein WCL07_00610 [bacterium]
MYKKIVIISLTSIILGGCSIVSNKEAATDVSPTTSPAPTPAPTIINPAASPIVDPELEKIPNTSASTEINSIESDLNNTNILPEDFSDIK